MSDTSISRSSSIMNVADIIDAAFGLSDENIVNHKLIQAVLFILARQLRVLERKVEIIGPPIAPSSSTLSITEIRLRAKKKALTGVISGMSVAGAKKKRPLSISGGKRRSNVREKGVAEKETRPKIAIEEEEEEETEEIFDEKQGKDIRGEEQRLSAKGGKKEKEGKKRIQTQEDEDENEKLDKTGTDKLNIDKTSLEMEKTSKSDSDKKSAKSATSTDTSRRKKGPLNRQVLEAFEEQREAILRIIPQRADSREEHDKSPTPMTSLDSLDEVQYEKLLVVERVSSEEAREREKAARKGRTQRPKLSIVTQEEFKALTQTVRQIQNKYKKIGKLELPENIELMHELRKGASLTDAMGALQLSARLEAAEKTLQNMMMLVTDLAQTTPGVHLKPGEDMKVIYGAPPSKTKSKASHKLSISAGPGTPTSKKSDKSKIMVPDSSASEESMEIYNEPMEIIKEPISQLCPTQEHLAVEEQDKNRVSFVELDEALQNVHDQIMSVVNENMTQNAFTSENLQKQVKKIESKLNASLDIGNKMEIVETLVSQYAEKVNALDASLSSQMTCFQEELTQMQHDLEMGLDTMAEVLANASTDTSAVTELNTHFTNLQVDIENTMYIQKTFQGTQELFGYDLESLRAEIEGLRDNKADRDEVTDALRDKAGLSELNGIVSSEQFEAFRNDFLKRILLAYDKFNNQELIWQKTIDDLTKDLHDKADITQINSLQAEIARNMGILTARLNEMLEIAGQPRATAVTKKLHRDGACLSCATPAFLESKASKVPALPGLRPPAIGAEAPRDHGDYEPCYPGKPIPHPTDPRAHFCKRWCGGSHTGLPTRSTKVPTGIKISTTIRDTTPILGTDGKVYEADVPLKKPCKQCNIQIPLEAEPDIAKEAEDTEAELPSTLLNQQLSL